MRVVLLCALIGGSALIKILTFLPGSGLIRGSVFIKIPRVLGDDSLILTIVVLL